MSDNLRSYTAAEQAAYERGYQRASQYRGPQIPMVSLLDHVFDEDDVLFNLVPPSIRAIIIEAGKDETMSEAEKRAFMVGVITRVTDLAKAQK